MARTLSRRVERNRQLIALGRADARKVLSNEVMALQALRHHEDRLTAGVELLVFSNNNRGQMLKIQSLDQPIAEWLRRSSRPPHKRGFPGAAPRPRDRRPARRPRPGA
ncbi:hypothetical protein [Nonomuraea sp. NPDC046570]|uniref:hypothetical protein n=1 Tax=Nonomuraea sp. NPDC046570 TaxID=3155255 RepID=UPI0033DCD164